MKEKNKDKKRSFEEFSKSIISKAVINSKVYLKDRTDREYIKHCCGKEKLSKGQALSLLLRTIDDTIEEDVIVTLKNCFSIIANFRIKKTDKDTKQMGEFSIARYTGISKEMYEYAESKAEFESLGAGQKSGFLSKLSRLNNQIKNDVESYIENEDIIAELTGLTEGQKANRLSIIALLLSGVTFALTLLIELLK